MKIYTRTGDGGETGLFGGPRVRKDDARVEAYGAVDELNAALGLTRTWCDDPEIAGHLGRIQDELFTIGAELATPEGSKARSAVPAVEPAWAAALEAAMDRWDAELPPLRLFILPGGSRVAASLHLARAVCRRAERRIVSLAAEVGVTPELLAYVNRLSDFLFVAARLANHRAQVAETIWDLRTRGRKP